MTFHVFTVRWVKSKDKWRLHKPNRRPSTYFNKKQSAINMGVELARNKADLEGETGKLAIFTKKGHRQDVRTYKP